MTELVTICGVPVLLFVKFISGLVRGLQKMQNFLTITLIFIYMFI